LPDGHLKGKVVVLDLWAVWCGLCIATFPPPPSGREVSGKGLVMIGLTAYDNFDRDEKADEASSSDTKVALRFSARPPTRSSPPSLTTRRPPAPTW
jgi:hypothetical protein